MTTWHRFGGQIPGLSPVHLPPDTAEFAENVYIGKGDALYPDFAPLDIETVLYSPDGTTFIGEPRTIWKSDGDWFAWPDRVSIVSDPRHYGSPEAFLYVSGGALWRMSGAWRQAGRRAQPLGVSRPTDIPTASLAGGREWAIPFPPVSDIPNPPAPPVDPIEDGSQPGEVRAYVYTLVNTMDEESAPSLPSVPVLVPPKTNVAVQAAHTRQANIRAWRWYRTLPGVEGTSLRFVAETELPELLDTQDPLSLGDELVTDQHYALADQIPYVVPQGITRLGETATVVWSDRDVFVSEARLPHAYPPKNRQQVPYPIVTCIGTPEFIEGTLPEPPEGRSTATHAEPSFVVYALTERRPFFLSERGGLTFKELAVDEPCVGASLATAAEGACVYLSTRGIIRLDPRSVEGLTDKLFTLPALAAYEIEATPSEWTLAYNQERFVLLGAMRSWVFIASTYARDRVLSWSASTVTGATTVSREGDGLYFASEGKIKKWGASEKRLIARWMSRREQMPEYFNPGAVKVDMPPGAVEPAIVRFWRNGYAWAQKTCYSQRPARLPRQGKGLYWTMEVITSEIVYRVMAEKSVGDLATVTEHRLEG